MNEILPGGDRQWTRGIARVGWTDEAVDLLRKLASERLSASQIAWKMRGRFPGVSRNAIIGKAQRCGIVLHGKQWWEDRQPKPRAPRPDLKPRPPRAPVCSKTKNLPPSPDGVARIGQGVRKRSEKIAALVERDLPSPGSLWIALADLRRADCRWPKGTPGESDFSYCGAPAHGRPYCPFHCGIAYETPQTRRKRRAAS